MVTTMEKQELEKRGIEETKRLLESLEEKDGKIDLMDAAYIVAKMVWTFAASCERMVGREKAKEVFSLVSAAACEAYLNGAYDAKTDKIK